MNFFDGLRKATRCANVNSSTSGHQNMSHHTRVQPTPLVFAPALALVVVLLTSCNKDTEQDARIAALEAAVAAAASADRDATARDETMATSQSAMASRLEEVERRTPGIGYFTPGWSYRGIRGANSLNVRATPIKDDPSHCRISGSFEFSGALPSPVVLSVFKEGGESAFETKVTLTEGGFDVKAAPIKCELVHRVSFAPK